MLDLWPLKKKRSWLGLAVFGALATSLLTPSLAGPDRRNNLYERWQSFRPQGVPAPGFERVIARLLNDLDAGCDGLEQTDLKIWLQFKKARLVSTRLAYYLAFDLDDDGRVSRSEVEQLHRIIASRMKNGDPEQAIRSSQRRAEAIFRFDPNSDGVLDLPEIFEIAESEFEKLQIEESPNLRVARDLLAMDPNGDGILTWPEALETSEVVTSGGEPGSQDRRQDILAAFKKFECAKNLVLEHD